MKRSKFNLTHTHSTTADAGQLIPFLLQPTLPGDRFRIGLKNFIRCQPMVAPLMHEVYFYTQYWYVPYRILWDNWEDFITGGENLQANPAFPYVKAPTGGWQPGSLADYFGFPTKQAGIEVSAMPFRAYAEIWNTRYRDEDLQNDVSVLYSDGLDNATSQDILSPSWKRDYFTLARPWTQRGSDIFVPVSSGESGTPVIHRHEFTYRTAFWFSSAVSYPLFAPFYEYGNAQITIDQNVVGDSEEIIPAGTYNYYTDNTNTVRDQNWYALSRLFYEDSGHQRWRVNIDEANLKIINDQLQGLSDFFANVPLSKETTGTAITITTDFEVVCECWFDGAKGRTVTMRLHNWPIIIDYYLSSDETVTVAGANTNAQFTGICDASPTSSTSRFIINNAESRVGNPPQCSLGGVWNKFVHYKTLTTVGSVSVRDLRASSALQRYAERSLKFGNRYEEFIQREFGVKPRDSRIQRPEYLGGGRGILNISEVLQTAEGTDTSVGTMRGHGIASVAQRPIRFKSPEHGIIIGLLSIRPKAVYTQGIEREFLKRSRLDFFTPELANIGMQEVLTQELFATSANKDSIFGYSDRYQEYRYHKPLVTGEFRDTLNYWNMARIFDNAPNLNDEFINMEYSSEVFKRPFAVQDQSYHSFLIMLENVIHAWRPIPKRAKDILK